MAGDRPRLAALTVLLASLAGCGQAAYTAPPAPVFTSGTPAAPAAGPTAAPTTVAPVEVDPTDVAADLPPGQSVPDDAGWSVADMKLGSSGE